MTHFTHTAKWIVDALFDNKLFRDDLTRDELNTIENHISDIMQMEYDSYLRMQSFIKKFDHLKQKHHEPRHPSETE